MDSPKVHRWSGKSAEDVLAESFHELRGPIYLMAGYLSVLIETDVTPEQLQSFKESLHRYALQSRDIVDSVYQYMNEQRKAQ